MELPQYQLRKIIFIYGALTGPIFLKGRIMSNDDIYNIIKEFIHEQREVNKLVIRHDEKLKSIWRIPVISGGTVSIITGIAILVIRLTS